MTRIHHSQSRWQNGFSLLEILVAMVVLSIGLLGLAGLQAVSLNNNQIAYYRSIASQQAYDMADRMRANLAGVTTGRYNSLTATLPSNPSCISAGCTVNQMATTDHFQWLTNNAALLPNGSGRVCLATNSPVDTTYDTTTPCTNTCATADSTAAYNANLPYVIVVTWTEKNAAANVTQGFCTAFQP